MLSGGEKSESLDELLKEAGEEAELVLENGLASSCAKKKEGQFGGDERFGNNISDEDGVSVFLFMLFVFWL